jgi:hypothetical protein
VSSHLELSTDQAYLPRARTRAVEGNGRRTRKRITGALCRREAQELWYTCGALPPYVSLMKACHEGQLDRVQKLWKVCSDDGHKMFCFSCFSDKDGSEHGIYENLLHTAFRRGHCDVVKFLLRQMRKGDDSSSNEEG